jgi:hypothetical protein
MKTLILILSLVSISVFFYEGKVRSDIQIPKASSRGIDIDDERYVAPYKLQWFNKDLNSSFSRKLRKGKNGC